MKKGQGGAVEDRMGPQGPPDPGEFAAMADQAVEQHRDIAEHQESGEQPPGLPIDPEPTPQSVEEMVKMGIIAPPGEEGLTVQDGRITDPRQPRDESLIPNEDGPSRQPRGVRTVVDELKSEKQRRQEAEEKNKGFETQFDAMKTEMTQMKYLLNMGANMIPGGVPANAPAPRERPNPPNTEELFGFKDGEIETTEDGAVTANGLQYALAKNAKGVITINEYNRSVDGERLDGVEDAFRRFGTDAFMKEADQVGGYKPNTHRNRLHKAVTNAMVKMLPDNTKREAAQVAKNLLDASFEEEHQSRDVAREKEATEKRAAANLDYGAAFPSGRGGDMGHDFLRVPATYEEADDWASAYMKGVPSTV